MANKIKITQQEQEEFRRAMAEESLAPSAASTSSNAVEDDDLPFPEVLLTDYKSEDYVEYRSSVLSKPDWKRLTRGEIQWSAALDLHHCTLSEAAARIKPFLRDCSQNNDKYTLIIHGKGLQSSQQPILKNAVASWLPTDPRVLGLCSARPRHGGTGAIYVQLRL